MKKGIAPTLTILSLMIMTSYAYGDAANKNLSIISKQPTAPYLLPGSPSFDLTLVEFRKNYNQANPTRPINEFRAIRARNPTPLLTRAASKINDHIYASTALEKGSGKIKSLQINYLPNEGREEKTAKSMAIDYMAALMRQFEPTLLESESISNVLDLLEHGKNVHFYTYPVGAIRYVVADNREKGLTFAIEPIKLALSEPKFATNE